MNPTGSGPATPRTRAIPRVLLVEDDPISHRLLRGILVLKGCEVVSATTQAEGLARLDGDLDYAILDLRLPDGDGETIFREIRSREMSVRVAVASAECDLARLSGLADLRPDLFVS